MFLFISSLIWIAVGYRMVLCYHWVASKISYISIVMKTKRETRKFVSSKKEKGKEFKK